LIANSLTVKFLLGIVLQSNVGCNELHVHY